MADKRSFMEVGVSVSDANFIRPGRYHLSFTLVVMPEPPSGRYENFSVQRHMEDAVQDHVTYTNSVDQRAPPAENQPPSLVAFSQGKFTFTAPAEYFISGADTDGDHEVSLLVEGIREELDREVSVGIGLIKVFPHPMLKGNLSKGYSSKEVVVLAQLLEADRLPVTWGRLRCTTWLAEAPTINGNDEGTALSAQPQELPQYPKPEASLDLDAVIVRAEKKPSVPRRLSASASHTGLQTYEVPPGDMVVEKTPRLLPGETHGELSRTMEETFSVPPGGSQWETPLELLDTLVPELPDIKVQTMPRAEDQGPSGQFDGGPVSACGAEDVLVIVHAAANLPLLPPDNKPPTPFTLLGVTGSGADSATRPTLQPSCHPAWHEALSVLLLGNNPNKQGAELSLRVADAASRQVLVTYDFPVCFLQPFHHYHLNLVTTVKNHPGGVHLFISIVRRLSSLPASGDTYKGLEVSLHGVREVLKAPCCPLLAVARIEDDLEGYQHRVRKDLKRSPGVAMTMVTFPCPHPTWFQVADTQWSACPQVSLLGEPANQPQWDHIFTFTECRPQTVFNTPLSALVIELYPLRAPKTGVWRLEEPVGYSSLLLSSHIYHQLAASQQANLGMRIAGLAIQGGVLNTQDKKTPSLDLTLRLIPDEECGASGSVTKRSHLQRLSYSPPSPIAPMYIRDSPQLCFSDIHLNLVPDQAGQSRPTVSGTTLTAWMSAAPHHDLPPADHLPRQKRVVYKLTRDPTRMPHKEQQIKSASESQLLKAQPLKDGELPSHDAIENLLPEYQYIVMDDDGPKNLHPRKNKDPAASPRPEDVERVSMSLLDYQQQELEKYRAAVHTMGEDLLTLRQQVQQLEQENSNLRRELDHYNDSTRLLLDAQELDGLSRANIAERYVALKHNLNRQSSELRDYKDKVLKVQNELIKKNDREKEYGRLSDAHQGQQATLQKLQERSAKVRRLEDVIRKQEKVIDKMEKIINSRSKGHNLKDSVGIDDSVKDALMEENKRLRTELETSTSVAERSSRETDAEDKERLELYTRLERTEGRIVSLERQLADNARQWARERSDLLVKLKESDIGLSRTPPLSNPRLSPVFTSIPKSKPRPRNDRQGEPRRFSRYFHEPSPERRHKPHIGYKPPLYDPVLHS